MLYQITNYKYPYPLKLTGDGYQFHFNLKNLSYYSKDCLLPNQDVELTPYIPTAEEQGKLLKEYQDWCATHEQEPNETLVSLLSSVDYWKEYKQGLLTAKSDLYEVNKCNEMYLTSSLGFKINADRRSLTNIIGLIDYFDIKQNEGTINFKDYNNKIQKLTKEQLQTLKAELIANSDGLYTQKWAKQDAINKAKSLDDINKVSLDFEMLDFSADKGKTLSKLLNM